MSSTDQGRHALILGASGITGWAIVNSILEGYPDKTTFNKITAVTNRPLSHEASQWPADNRLQMVSGLDLMAGSQDTLDSVFEQKVSDIDTVSHLYFYAYQQNDNEKIECDVNRSMLERSVKAVEHNSTKLEYVVLPSGTKIYGVHMLDKFPFADSLPIKETAPPLPSPWVDNLFYYDQIDCLKALSKGKPWTWCEIRPDNIIGFVPNNNAYCLAQTLALYLALYKWVEGSGASCPFPGSSKSWTALYNESPQDMVARFSIHASLNPDKTAGKSFNCAGEETSWSHKWPIICKNFGLAGEAPTEGSLGPSEYIKKHRTQWDEMATANDLKKGFVDNNVSHPIFQYFIMTLLDFDRHMDMSAMKSTGYTEMIDSERCWTLAFDRMRQAKIIP